MLQKTSRLSSALLLIFLLSSCSADEQKEDTVQTVSKNASIETAVSVQHGDSVDLLITKHKVWVKNNLVREFTTRDTIPALGDTVITTEHNGNEVHHAGKKEYEFYITVQ